MRTRALRLDSRRKTAEPREQMYGVTIRRGVDLPNAIDDSTDRANLFAVVHRIWRDACDSACRSQALQAALQYRLSQEQGFEASPLLLYLWLSALLRNGPAGWPFRIPICRIVIRWRLRWPGRRANQIDVGAAFEALAPRAPIEIWTGDDALLVPRFVAGLAALFAEADVRDLDAALTRRASDRRDGHTPRAVRLTAIAISAPAM